MNVKILGPGCKNCERLEARTREALEELGLDASVEKVTDYAQIAAYGVMKTPGLVVELALGAGRGLGLAEVDVHHTGGHDETLGVSQEEGGVGAPGLPTQLIGARPNPANPSVTT